MPSTQNAVNNREYRSVPITALAESATNPRKRFDAKSLEELAASFKTQGILAPLLVRELEESKYEVVAGARRLRAAKLAELEKLPVRVVKLTDAEAIEAQCVENLQREDIHPLEEALGFKSLLELGEPAYSIATIASRAGTSEAYVYGRIRLADLIPPVADASFSAASRAGAGRGTEAHRKGETGDHDSPSCLGHDPPTGKRKSRPELCCAATGGYPLNLLRHCKGFHGFSAV
jgi:ParB/RepB/Spo0J family partition protein